jgi:DNA polymerase-3 subunit delta
MRLRFDELAGHLDRQLAGIYLLSGDEPLQMGEAADLIRNNARKRGYSERDILEADSRFDWNQLIAEANSLSLFAEKRIIDLRIPSGKPGKEGGKALVEYAERPPEDTLLLITMPKLDRSQTSSKWCKTLEQSGVHLQIWPIELDRLPAWIDKRMQGAGLVPERDVTTMLAERVEGNLLAAAQEIEKLLLLHGPGTITLEKLAESVSDSARYDVFGLVDSALDGKVARCIRILNGLRAEGTPPAVVLWALSRELRLMNNLASRIQGGQPIQQAVASERNIWDKRKPLVRKGLQRLRPGVWRRLLLLCGSTDRAIKGHDRRDPWLLLQDIATGMAGAPLLQHSAG